MIDHYLSTTYQRYGRGPDVFDCWGLVRDARVTIFGKPLLASYGEIGGDDARGMTEAVNATIASDLVPVKKSIGVMAMGWRGRLCVHVGIVVEVDGRLWVLETDVSTGPVLSRISDFESRYLKVTYHDD